MDTEEERTIWCGNLSENVTEELLYELFLQTAPVQRVKIPVDKEGKIANYAFITLKHELSVPYVLKLLNGITLYDRKLNLKRRNSNQNSSINRGELNILSTVFLPSSDSFLYSPTNYSQNYASSYHRSEKYSNRNEVRKEDSKPYKQNQNRHNRTKRHGNNYYNNYDRNRNHRNF